MKFRKGSIFDRKTRPHRVLWGRKETFLPQRTRRLGAKHHLKKCYHILQFNMLSQKTGYKTWPLENTSYLISNKNLTKRLNTFFAKHNHLTKMVYVISRGNMMFDPQSLPHEKLQYIWLLNMTSRTDTLFGHEKAQYFIIHHDLMQSHDI